MARRFPRPDKSTPFLESDGKTVNQAWFDFLGYLDTQIAAGVSGAADVKIVGALTNGQKLTWVSADSKWENV
jgi:hypothetical protein